MIALTKPLGLVPVHHDIRPENVMRRGHRLLLIDAYPVSLGLAFADVSCAGLYFAPQGEVAQGLQRAASLYGVAPSEMRAYYAVAFLKLARRAGVVLEQWLRAPARVQRQEATRIETILVDAEQAFALAG